MLMALESPSSVTRQQPLGGFDHMHLVACREGQEVSLLVVRQSKRRLPTAIERRNVLALGRERLQSIVPAVCDDDSALMVYAHAMRSVELTRLIASRAELVHECALGCGEHLHLIVVTIGDDQSVSLVVDRHAHGVRELDGLATLLGADEERERQVLQAQHLQTAVIRVDDDDVLVAVVDRQARNVGELESLRLWTETSRAEARLDRVVERRQNLHAPVLVVRDKEALVDVVDCDAIRELELAWLVPRLSELAHECTIARREHLNAIVVRVYDEQMASNRVERHSVRLRELSITTPVHSVTNRILDLRSVD